MKILHNEQLVKKLENKITALEREIAGRKQLEKSLRESEERYRSLIENSTSVILALTPDYELVEFNVEAERLYGKKREDVLGKNYLELFIPEEDREAVAAEINKVLAGKPIRGFENREWAYDGCKHVLTWNANHLVNYKGETTGVIALGQDITERLQTERTLQRITKAVDSTSDAIGISDPQGHHFYHNAAFTDLFEYTADELAAAGGGPAVYADQDIARDVFNNIMSGKSWSGEIEMFSKSGRRFPVDLRADAIKDDRGNIIGLIGVHTDITDRKQAEERVRSLNSLNEELLAPGSIDKNLKRITDGIVDIFGADFARIWITKPGDHCKSKCLHAKVTDGPHVCRYRDRCLHLKASSGRYTNINGEVHRRVPFGCYKIGRVAASEDKKFITNDVVNDSRIHDRNWAGSLGLVSFAGYRLLSDEGEPVGVLALFSKKPILPDEDALLEGLANTAAHVIQKAKLEEKEKNRTAQIIHNQDVLLALAKKEHPDLNSAMETLTRVGAETLDVERISIWFFNKNRSGITCKTLYNLSKNSYEKGPQLQARQYPRYFHALEESRILAASDAYDDPCTHEFAASYLKPLGVTSIMDVPIRLHGNVVGIVCHEHTGPKREWTLVEQHFAVSIADMVSLAMEASELKSTQEALRASEERYRLLFDLSVNPILLFDKRGNIELINQAAARYLGGIPVNFAGKSLHDIFPSQADDLMEKHRQCFESGQGVEFEISMFLPVGKKSFYSIVNPIRNNEGQIFAVQVMSYDITERKRAEEDLKESAKKIKLFAYSVSHDIKNPTISIHLLTKYLHKNYKHILDEKGMNYCDQILNASEQLATLVEQINVYISTKESPITIESANLGQLLQMVKDEFSAKIDIRQISWFQPESLPEVYADRLSIMRVLRNFVDNALKYGGEKLTIISIGYEESDDFHIISVMDDGIGIAEKDTKNIFGIFNRNVTSRGIEGSGLGLAIAKEIAEQHHGKVWAEPGQKKGVRFYISISKDLKQTN